MHCEQAYNNGRFSVPPKFDFKILPSKSKKVTVVAVIGECDTFLGDTTFIHLFGPPCGEKLGSVRNPSYNSNEMKESVGTYIDGYYDCEKQIIYLCLKPLTQDTLLNSLISGEQCIEDVYNNLEVAYMKSLLYLFIVSHFVVVFSVGSRLNPKYIRALKLIDKIRIEMRLALDSCLRTLPLPRDWLVSRRASVPRMLFVFKLLPQVAKRISTDPSAVRTLEQSLVTQVFNTFCELGLANNQLFTLPGHNFVHVMLGNEYSSSKYQQPMIHDDLAQDYLDFILTNVREPEDLDQSTHQKQVYKSFDSAEPCMPPITPWNYPPPDQPEEHTLKAFLHLHVTTMLEQVNNRNAAFGLTPVVHELPTCKSWFMACYKLYTSLMSDESLGVGNAPDMTETGKPDSQAGGTASLAQAWHRAFQIALSAPSTAMRTSVASLPIASVLDVEEPETPAKTTVTRPNDLLRRLSDARCRAAISAAEAHYKTDLPIHYSNTYHLVKVVSAFNVFLSLARGPTVFRTLEQLSQRLAHLYLAGRVTCSAVSVTGHACQHEMHCVPDDSVLLRSVLAGLDRRTLYGDDAALDRAYAARLPGFRRNHPHGLDCKLSLNRLIPDGLFGKWRAYWMESLLKTNSPETSTGSNLPGERSHKLNPTVSKPESEEVECTPVKDDTVGATTLDDKQHLAVMAHRSQHMLLRACNCGRVQDLCRDPFDYKDANWRFYASVASVCCNKLVSIPVAPLWLMHPGHPFCLPEDDEVREVERTVPATDRAHPSPPSPTTGLHADHVTRTEPVAVLTRRLASHNDKGPTNNGAGDGDKLSNPMLDTGGLSQPPENPMLMLSPTDSAHPEHASSSQEPPELADVGFDEAVKDLSVPDRLDSESSDMDSLASSTRDRRSSAVATRGSDESDDDDDDELLAGLPRGLTRQSKSRSRNVSPGTATSSSSERSTPPTYVVRFRDGVPASNWLLGELPRYPSWSIHALGKYFSYSHSSGLSYAGFLRNSNFLLPWDVTVGSEAWGHGGRGAGKTGRGKFRAGRGDSDTVKLFIGFEMECPLGHRFFLAGPDRAMDGPMQSSQVRYAVQGLLTRDLPLFMPCRGHRPGTAESSAARRDPASAEWRHSYSPRDDLSMWAQLTRIYLAIPAAPIRVRFRPRVRPGPIHSTPVFHLGPTIAQFEDHLGLSDSGSDMDDEDDELEVEQKTLDRARSNVTRTTSAEELGSNSRAKVAPITVSKGRQRPGFVLLDNGLLWVARLPFTYHDGNQLFTRPTTPEQANKWRLLKGSIKLQF